MIKRKIYYEIRNHLSKKEITIVTGARQVGKTTLLKHIGFELEKEGKSVLYFNLDFENDKQYFESQEKLIKKIELELGNRGGVVYIDEIQRKENAGLFLKGIYDRDLPYKIMVTGSGSLELKEKIHESLAGRKRIFNMSTVSFEEFVNYKTGYKYENNLKDFFSLEVSTSDFLLLEYLNYGGYPRIVTETDPNEKKQLLDEIFTSYIEKDIISILNIERYEVYTRMIKLLSYHCGKILNHSELASSLGINFHPLMKYLWFTEKTFIIRLLTPFSKSYKKELTRSPVVYFNDIGFKNFANNSLGQIFFMSEGFTFQNFIYSILNEIAVESNASLHFWRTTDKAEIDFVFVLGNKIIPIEIKFSKMPTPSVPKAMHSFIHKYSIAEAWIINLSLDTSITIENTKVRFVPYYRLITDGIL